MSDKKFQRFGKYLILDHLVDGGMAKICRATYLGEQANKIVAIKMVQPQYSKNPSYVQMFESNCSICCILSLKSPHLNKSPFSYWTQFHFGIPVFLVHLES